MRQQEIYIVNCIKYIKELERQEMFLLAFYQEMITGEVNEVIANNPMLFCRYYLFKQQYLMELATCNSLIEQQYYLNSLNANMYPEYVLEVA